MSFLCSRLNSQNFLKLRSVICDVNTLVKLILHIVEEVPGLAIFLIFLKESKKSDLFDLNQSFYLNRFVLFFFFLSNHPTPLVVNQSNSAQRLRVANSNYALKIKQIYIQIKEINEVKF